METCIEYCEPGWAYMSSDERRWVNHLRKLAEQHPDECVILKQPEENQGFIYAKFPQKWARVKPPQQRVMSDEKRANLIENLRRYRESQIKEKDGDGTWTR